MKSLKVAVGVFRGNSSKSAVTLFCPVCREPLTAYRCGIRREDMEIFVNCHNPRGRHGEQGDNGWSLIEDRVGPASGRLISAKPIATNTRRERRR